MMFRSLLRHHRLINLPTVRHCASSTASRFKNSSGRALAGASIVLSCGAIFIVAVNNAEHSAMFMSTRPCKAKCHGSTPPCKSRRERLSEYLSSFAKENDNNDAAMFSLLPEYTSEQVAQHDTAEDGGRVWMSYGGFVYDVTDFIPLHPGGTERISRAAGAAMEPFWYLHRQHFETEEPMRILRALVVGRLKQSDQDKIDEQLETMEDQINRFRLELDFDNSDKNWTILSLADLKALPKTDLASKVGCPQSGRPTTTSLFGGVLMKDLLRVVQKDEEYPVQSLIFHAMDGETVIVKTDDNYRGILVAYEENGAPLTQQRGFPLRIIIPGRRVVKWVKRIEVRSI